MDSGEQQFNDDIAKGILDELSQPFDRALIKQRQVAGPGGGQRMLDYLDLMTVVDRLNTVAPGWHNRVKSQDIRPFGTTNQGGHPRLMLTAVVEVYIPGVGTHEHMGVQVVNADTGGEDLWKGAISDGIKKAASLFGVGRELYGDDPVHIPAQQAPSRPAQASLNQPVRPPGDRPVIMNPTGEVSPAQRDLILRLGYERGYAYSVIENTLASINRGEASRVIEQLRAEQGVRRLERSDPIPQDWIDGAENPPF